MNNKRLTCLLTLFVVCVVTMAVDNTIYNVRETPKSGFFPLSKSAIYTDAADYKVVGIAAGMLADDIERVTSLRPIQKTVKQLPKGISVVAGTLGKSRIIEGLVKSLNGHEVS